MVSPVAPVNPGSVVESDGEALFLVHLDVVHGILARIRRRNRLGVDEAEEFRSLAYLKLIDHDYQVFRRFRHRCSMETYLAVVLQRLLLDYRVARWGKWRPTAGALRSGQAAVDVERLVIRDGVPLEQCVSRLGLSERAARDLRVLIDQRPARRPRTLPELFLLDRTDETPLPEERLARAALAGTARQVWRLLRRLIAALPPEDRLIVKLRFFQGATIASIARILGVPQIPLYRRLDRILAGLKSNLQQAGCADLAAALAADATWSDLVIVADQPIPDRSHIAHRHDTNLVHAPQTLSGRPDPGAAPRFAFAGSLASSSPGAS